MRLGIMYVSVELFNSVVPEYKKEFIKNLGEVVILRPDMDWLRYTLRLPTNCHIDSVSSHFAFHKQQITLRIECEDFVDTPEVGIIPEVEANYRAIKEWEPGDGFLGAGVFSHWTGGVRDNYKYARVKERLDRWQELNEANASKLGNPYVVLEDASDGEIAEMKEEFEERHRGSPANLSDAKIAEATALIGPPPVNFREFI